MTENIFGSFFESSQRKKTKATKATRTPKQLPQKRRREPTNFSLKNDEGGTAKRQKNTNKIKRQIFSRTAKDSGSQQHDTNAQLNEEELRKELRKIMNNGGLYDDDQNGEDDSVIDDLSSSLVDDDDDNDHESSDGSTRKSFPSEASKLSSSPNENKNSNKIDEIDTKSKRKRRSERTIFVGNLPLEITKLKLIELFKSCGKIFDVRLLPQVIQGKQTCVGFIEFKSVTSAQKALEMHGTSVMGQRVQVRIANHKKTQEKELTNEQKVFTLYVKNLDFSTTEETLRNIFGKCGDIQSIRLPIFPDSRKPRGYGFIDFKEETALRNALRLNRIEVNGRQLLLEISKPQTKTKTSGSQPQK